MPREIIVIDEEKCDGCGLCIPSCHEGALELINGKVRLVADKLCDGLGACLGDCPKGALHVEIREAASFDEVAVAERLRELQENKAPQACPSSQFVPISSLGSASASQDPSFDDVPSELSHWPVQLRLLPPNAPAFRGASLLLAADCVPVAFPQFHQKLLKGHSVAVACPKLDDSREHLKRLTEILRHNDLRDITVAHMEVPCCSGLLMMVLEARRLSGKDTPIKDIVIGTQGEILAEKHVAADVRIGSPA